MKHLLFTKRLRIGVGARFPHLRDPVPLDRHESPIPDGNKAVQPGLAKSRQAFLAQENEPLRSYSKAYWRDIWCARVLNWHELLASPGFTALDMLQTVTREDDVAIETTRSPIRIDGLRHKVSRAAPRVGEHSAAIRAEFGL